MKTSAAALKAQLSEPQGSILQARLAGISDDGEPLVRLPGQEGMLKARSLVRFRSRDEAEQHVGADVLIVLVDGQPEAPVIVGFPVDSLYGADKESVLEIDDPRQDLILNARRIEFRADDEVVLECGQGKIKLRHDGSVVVLGKKITNRAKETNKIRGASVQIN